MVTSKEHKPLVINARLWNKERSKHKEVARGIKELFDEKKLSRKGQKGYKRRLVREMEGD